MADKNVNSEQDNAYIATLLSKLRESLGQTDATPAAAETPVPAADAVPEATPSTDDAVPAPTGESISEEEKEDVSAVPEEESTPAAGVSPECPPEEDASDLAPFPVNDALQDVPSDAAQSFSETEATGEVVVSPEALPEKTDTPEKAEGSTEMTEAAAEAPPPVAPSESTDAASGMADASFDADEKPADDAGSAAGAYARTVQPGDPRFSGRNTAGRFLDFQVDDTENIPVREAPSSPLDSILETPLFPHAAEAETDASAGIVNVDGGASSVTEPAVPAGADFSGADDGIITDFEGIAPGMPIPDRVTDAHAAADRPDAPAPASIWDTLPPLPREETEATAAPGAAAPAADPVPSVAAETPVRAGGLFGRRTRPTIADCTFETSAQGNIIVDKVLAASQDLLPEGAKEKQESLWRQELRHKRLIIRMRVIAVGVLLLLSLAVELIPPFPRALLSRLLLTRVPGALHLIDLQILLLAALIGAPQIVRGFSALRFRRIIPETLLSCAMTVSLIAGIVLTVVDLSGTYFCSLPAVLMLFASLMGDLFRLRALSRAFDSYAAKGHHFCTVFSDVRTHPLLGDEFRDAKNPNLFETASSSGIERFVSASRRRVECRRAAWITFAIAGVASLLSLLLSLVMRRTASEAIWAFTLTLTGVMPLTLFGVHRYLFAMLTFRVSEERVGIADEMTVYDYAHTGVMTFEDTEAFPAGSVQLNGIKLCGDFRLDKALYLTASVFDAVGGPLNGVFRVSTSDINISDNVDIRALFEDGIDARVNHDDVLIGTKAFLEARGVSVFRDVEDERAEQGRARVLYLAYMGTLSAKFHLNYRMSDTFESNVEYYAKHGVTSAILTADPLLDRAFLDRISYVSEYDVRIVKKTRDALLGEDDGPREATLITYGPRKTLRRMPFFFGIYARYQAIVIAVMMVMASLAAIYLPVLLCFMQGTVPWLPFITQLVAGVPCIVFGFFIQRLNPNK